MRGQNSPHIFTSGVSYSPKRFHTPGADVTRDQNSPQIFTSGVSSTCCSRRTRFRTSPISQ